MIKLKNILLDSVQTLPKYFIFLDLDGVVVDFNGTVKKQTGLLPREYELKYGTTQFWKFINDQGSIWWETLPWTTEGKLLYNTLKQYKFPIQILTSGSTKNTGKLAYIGKTKWVYNNLDKNIKTIVTASSRDKQQYSGKYRILIDDMKDNISEWRLRGGIGILHTSYKDTINQLNNYIYSK